MGKLAVLSAVVAFVGGVSAASAADLSAHGGSYKDGPYEAPIAPIWGGLYVGGHLGGLWNDAGDTSKWKRWCYGENECSKWKEDTHVKFDEGDDDVTFVGGVHAGYNWQSDARVFGIEGDVSFGDGLDYLASLRARLGYAQDNLLLYVTAGAAFAGFDDTSVTMSYGKKKVGELDFSGDSKVGFVAGIGAEYKLRPNWSIGVEGLYYAFGDGDDSKEWDAYCKQYKISHDDDNDLFVVRARMSYHFQDDAYESPLK
jgi:outer membrane immunogenic protein